MNENNYTQERDIDFKELFSILRKRWITIISITTTFAVISIIYSLLIPNQYMSSLTVSSSVSETSSLSNLAGSQLGGLASLAGINVGNQATSDSQIAIEIMQSWSFIDNFIEKNGLAVTLMAAKGWNRDTKELIIDESIYDSTKDQWVRKASKYKTSEPTSWEMYKKFSSILNVSQDSISNLITVSIQHNSPYIATEWAELFIHSINEYMRVRKLNQVNANISYLEEQASKTSLSETKTVFYKIIEDEIKNKMLAEVSYEYSFITVKKAMVPEEKHSPKRSQIVALITLLGGILALLIIIVAHYSGVRIKYISD